MIASLSCSDLSQDEIEVLFSLFFRILDPSQPSHEDMRHLVLATLLRIVADNDVLVSLYINYDCDPSSEDIFSKMMQLLSLYINGVPPTEDSGSFFIPNLISSSFLLLFSFSRIR
jgi:Sec7-like guanine-nucleotide exchange factor